MNLFILKYFFFFSLIGPTEFFFHHIYIYIYIYSNWHFFIDGRNLLNPVKSIWSTSLMPTQPHMNQTKELSLTLISTPCILKQLLRPSVDSHTSLQNWHELHVSWPGRTCVKSARICLPSWLESSTADVTNMFRKSVRNSCQVLFPMNSFQNGVFDPLCFKCFTAF